MAIIIILQFFGRYLIIDKYMYFEDDANLPALIPIKASKKKRKEDLLDENGKEISQEDVLSIMAKQFEKQHPEKEQRKQEKEAKPSLAPDKIQQFDKKFHNLQEKVKKREEKHVKINNYKQKQNQKSKHMITEMMKKIDAKNITEELYPATNESILGFISKIDLEVEELKVEAERKENYLITNPNNQHLKKELETLKVAIDRCVLIKELYNEKINLRNKVSVLEKSLIQLREDNQNLNIKNIRETETLENHSLGKPCSRELELKDELTKCQSELKKEKSMKEKLEKNINEIVQNFKRLYGEAETARTIVAKKLKEIQEKQKMLIERNDVESEQQIAHGYQKNLNKIQELEARRQKASQNNNTSNIDLAKTNRKAQNYNQSDQKAKTKDYEKNRSKQQTLEQQILKMRGNSTNVKISHKR